MISPSRIQLTQKQFSGLYESYYFRGVHQDGSSAFWLKHNLLKPDHRDSIFVESTCVLFFRDQPKVWVVKKNQQISQKEYLHQMDRCKYDWDQFAFQFLDGSFLSIQPNKLEGSIHSEKGKASWDFSLDHLGQAYFHFSHPWFYKGPFPRKKILTRDTHVIFRGEVRVDDQRVSGDFVGMNGHNWGKEHAPVYAYANCNQWAKQRDATFDGFSAKIHLWPTRRLSPYLSCASLRFENTWVHFNQVSRAYLHTVKRLSVRQWEVIYCNVNWILRVKIDGDDVPWVALPYEHPSGEISTVRNTKFATGRFTLKKKGSSRIFCSLRSSVVEFETSGPSYGSFLIGS